ncbi:MAG: glycoside hydrolase family 140 protein [Verrucomicrobiales bacterium]
MSPVIASLRRLGARTLLVAAALAPSAPAAPAPHPIRIADTGRHLVTGDGQPFFWLGDTAWELFHRLDREEAEAYLTHRAARGFNVIQAVALAELDGLNVPNVYGHRPLIDNDPLRPDVKDGSDNDYWDHVDWIVTWANELGLTIGFLPTWGDKWNRAWGAGPEIFTVENARAYGRWLGERYRDRSIVWILGGDRAPDLPVHRDINRAMAQGLSEGDGGDHLITFHPTGGRGASEWFHGESWLDFSMRQNGHVAEFTGRYDKTGEDYRRQPTKPIIDGEPIYEGHPINFKAAELGHSLAADVRRPLYWNLFTGAFGHTYGHHSVWQMYDPKRHAPINAPLMSWREALDEPGAAQMQHARSLMLSRPFLEFVPDPTVIVADTVPTSVPGAGRYAFVATRTASGSCALVYVPAGRRFHVRLDAITGDPVKAWWFDPRLGTAQEIGTFPNTGAKAFTPPQHGEALDWVLVLDDASRAFAAPGR